MPKFLIGGYMKIQVKRKTFKMNKSDDSQPVDLSYLQEYTDGDDDVMDELIEAFQETALEGLEELKKGVYETEMTVWNAAAHKLKGAAGYVGPPNLRRCVWKLKEVGWLKVISVQIYLTKSKRAMRLYANFLRNEINDYRRRKE